MCPSLACYGAILKLMCAAGEQLHLGEGAWQYGGDHMVNHTLHRTVGAPVVSSETDARAERTLIPGRPGMESAPSQLNW